MKVGLRGLRFEAATWQEASAPSPGSQGLKEKQFLSECFQNAFGLQEHLKDLVDGKLTQAQPVKLPVCVPRTHIVAFQASSSAIDTQSGQVAEGMSCPTLRCSHDYFTPLCGDEPSWFRGA